MKPHPFSENPSHSATVKASQPPKAAHRLGQIWPRGAFGRLGATIAFSFRRIWRHPVGRPEPIWPAALTAPVLAGICLVAVFFSVDAVVMDTVLNNRNQTTRWLGTFSNIGKSEWYLVPAAFLYLATATADWRNAGYRAKTRLLTLFGQAAFLFCAVAITGLSVNVVKIVVGRARPSRFGEFGAYHFDPLVVSKYFSSFPSGHSTTLGTVAVVAIIWFPRYWLPILVAGFLFSMLRVVATAHYPSDVVAGYMFGAVLTVLMARFLAARRVAFAPQRGKILPAVIGLRQKKPAQV